MWTTWVESWACSSCGAVSEAGRAGAGNDARVKGRNDGGGGASLWPAVGSGVSARVTIASRVTSASHSGSGCESVTAGRGLQHRRLFVSSFAPAPATWPTGLRCPLLTQTMQSNGTIRPQQCTAPVAQATAKAGRPLLSAWCSEYAGWHHLARKPSPPAHSCHSIPRSVVMSARAAWQSALVRANSAGKACPSGGPRRIAIRMSMTISMRSCLAISMRSWLDEEQESEEDE